ncbi:MAG: GNAT family N-acetyltransferase, partial [Saccharospirillum sp.]
MDWTTIDLSEKPALHDAAARLLMDAFLAKGNTAWPTLERARQTLDECAGAPNLCLGLLSNGTLAGWGGLRPMYDKTWELHPLVVAPALSMPAKNSLQIFCIKMPMMFYGRLDGK